MTYEDLDWNAESARVARAFGVKQPVQFAPMQDDAAYFKCLFTVADEPQLYVPISSVLSIEVSYHSVAQFAGGMKYSQVHRTGTMIEGHSMYSARMELNWAGAMTPSFLNLQKQRGDWLPWYHHRFALPLAKGLFHLDLLTPEVEDALKVSISQHQKMEWTLDFEASDKSQ